MPGNSSVCGACVADLERALGDVGFYYFQLRVSFTKQTAMERGGAATRHHETAVGILGGDRAPGVLIATPLPYDPRPGRIAHELRNTLVGWVRDLLEQSGTPVYGPVCLACRHTSCAAAKRTRVPANTPAAMAAWLLLHIVDIARHEAGSEIVASVSGAIERAERIVDRPADRIYAGPCDGCGEDLYGRLGAAVVHCWCRMQYDVVARRDWLLWAAEDVLATATDIARAVTRLGEPISVERIWKWAERKRIFSHGQDDHGRPLYRVGDVLDTLALMALKKAG